MKINVTNKLEVKRGGSGGGYIQVPGCEPLSNLTSIVLLANFKCNNSIVTLNDALEAIPDAQIELTFNPLTRWFVLPSGPPPGFGCAEFTCDDWYEVLRQIEPSTAAEDMLDCGTYKDSFDYFGGPKIK